MGQRNTKQNIHEHQNEEKYYNFQREQSKEWAIATDFQHDSIKSAGNLLESLKEQMCFQSWYLDEERYLGVAMKMSDTWQKSHKQSRAESNRRDRRDLPEASWKRSWPIRKRPGGEDVRKWMWKLCGGAVFPLSEMAAQKVTNWHCIGIGRQALYVAQAIGSFRGKKTSWM